MIMLICCFLKTANHCTHRYQGLRTRCIPSYMVKIRLNSSLLAQFYFLVDDGAIVDVQFSAFWFSPPKGFEEIMVEQTIL